MAIKLKAAKHKLGKLKELTKIEKAKAVDLNKATGSISHRLIKKSLKGNTDPNVDAGEW